MVCMHATTTKALCTKRSTFFFFFFFYGLFPLYLYYDSISCEGSDNQVPSVFCLQNLLCRAHKNYHIALKPEQNQPSPPLRHDLSGRKEIDSSVFWPPQTSQTCSGF